MNQPITVLVVDDHSIVRHGITSYLDMLPDIEVVGEASSGEEAIKAVDKLLPEVTLMDLAMPGMDGVEATRRITRISPHTRVIILTSYEEDEHIFPAIQAGALSYLLKDTQPEAIADAIRSAQIGEATLSPSVATRLVQEARGPRSDRPNTFTELSERELEVLRLVANGKTNAEIAEELVISQRTVKSHVSNILSKLHLANRVQATLYALQEGITSIEDSL